MKRSMITALGATVIAIFGASSAAEAAVINFTVTGVDGSPTYTGASLDESTAVDFDTAFLLVTEVDAGDASGLAPFDTVSLSPMEVVYGGGTGPTTLPSFLTKSWTGDNGDTFTETLTNVDLIDRGSPDEITVRLSGTVSDTLGLFADAPAFFVLKATQFGGVGTATSVSFTNTANTGVIPEPSTWVMMGLGFGALGYAASRRGKAKIAMLSA